MITLLTLMMKAMSKQMRQRKIKSICRNQYKQLKCWLNMFQRLNLHQNLFHSIKIHLNMLKLIVNMLNLAVLRKFIYASSNLEENLLLNLNSSMQTCSSLQKFYAFTVFFSLVEPKDNVEVLKDPN